jgi:hypothetical protein
MLRFVGIWVGNFLVENFYGVFLEFFEVFG